MALILSNIKVIAMNDATVLPERIAIINIYPSMYKALGFNDVPDRILVKHIEGDNSPYRFSMNIYQEDDMVQLVVPEGEMFYLASESNSLAAAVVDGELQTTFGDTAEPENLTTSTVIGRLQMLRFDHNYGHIHPEVEDYIRSTSEDETEATNKINAYFERLIEDSGLIEIVEARKNQERIRVDVNEL